MLYILTIYETILKKCYQQGKSVTVYTVLGGKNNMSSALYPNDFVLSQVK